MQSSTNQLGSNRFSEKWNNKIKKIHLTLFEKNTFILLPLLFDGVKYVRHWRSTCRRYNIICVLVLCDQVLHNPGIWTLYKLFLRTTVSRCTRYEVTKWSYTAFLIFSLNIFVLEWTLTLRNVALSEKHLFYNTKNTMVSFACIC